VPDVAPVRPLLPAESVGNGCSGDTAQVRAEEGAMNVEHVGPGPVQSRSYLSRRSFPGASAGLASLVTSGWKRLRVDNHKANACSVSQAGNIILVTGHDLRSRSGRNRHDRGVCNISGARPAEELSNDVSQPLIKRTNVAAPQQAPQLNLPRGPTDLSEDRRRNDRHDAGFKAHAVIGPQQSVVAFGRDKGRHRARLPSWGTPRSYHASPPACAGGTVPDLRQFGFGQQTVLGFRFRHRSQPLTNFKSEACGVGDPGRHADATARGRRADLLVHVGGNRDRQLW